MILSMASRGRITPPPRPGPRRGSSGTRRRHRPSRRWQPECRGQGAGGRGRTRGRGRREPARPPRTYTSRLGYRHRSPADALTTSAGSCGAGASVPITEMLAAARSPTIRWSLPDRRCGTPEAACLDNLGTLGPGTLWLSGRAVPGARRRSRRPGTGRGRCWWRSCRSLVGCRRRCWTPSTASTRPGPGRPRWSAGSPTRWWPGWGGSGRWWSGPTPTGPGPGSPTWPSTSRWCGSRWSPPPGRRSCCTGSSRTPRSPRGGCGGWWWRPRPGWPGSRPGWWWTPAGTPTCATSPGWAMSWPGPRSRPRPSPPPSGW